MGSHTILQSLRYAFRSLSRRPGFAALSILALALGLGANASIFRVVDAVLLRPLPYPDADRIVMRQGTEMTERAEELITEVTGATETNCRSLFALLSRW